ncbi:pentapeptide repeat-containing protein [Halovenus rubra]|uniref:Pentapeptide repeat-containing protein n=2 Tax=Halovenus rubra TaxID=869890 RepID=A0ABD5X3C4_9EURY|nr:pentapeptide repeat-containing protein [Halovenus rubra]
MVTNKQQQCSYEYEHLTETEPADIISLSRPPETVQCPHTLPAADVETCLFHGVDKEYPREKATESFLTALEEGPTHNSFAGAYLPGLDLAGETITTPDERPLDLRGAIIDGVVDLTDARITVPVILDGATIMQELKAENTVFEGPVSLVDTALQKGLYWQGATVKGGIVANNVDAQYVDWRDVTVEGPVTFEDGSFASSLKFARGKIDGPFVLAGTTFDWHIDATMLSVEGDFDTTGMTVDGNVDFVGVSITGSLALEKTHIGGELNCDHMVVGEDLQGSKLTVEESGQFEDVRVKGGPVILDGAEIGGKADFASMVISNGRFSATTAVFDDEVWFTHAEIAGTADFSNATLNGPGHLRDVHFESDLQYQNVDDTETSTWMAGTTIEGDLDCTDTAFEHFQFSATVEGDADFTGTEYNSQALFRSSTFEGQVWFDDTLFTGTPNFSKSQFTDQVSFDDAEFMVEPTFEDARFATDPTLEEAEFLTNIDASVEERYRRWELVLVHPESLENTNLSVPVTAVGPDFSVPIALTHLAEEVPGKTKTFLDALGEIESQEWHEVMDDALSVARTAATQVNDPTSSWLVFGFELIDSESNSAEFLSSAKLAGVYERDEGEFAFSHLATDLADLDYLVPVPVTDAAFDAGAGVATSSEVRKAMIRHERVRLRELLEGGSSETEKSDVHRAVVPLLVGAGDL